MAVHVFFEIPRFSKPPKTDFGTCFENVKSHNLPVRLFKSLGSLPQCHAVDAHE